MLCVYVSGSHRIIETDYDDAITVVSSGGWGGSHGDRYHAVSCPSQDERERIKTFFFFSVQTIRFITESRFLFGIQACYVLSKELTPIYSSLETKIRYSFLTIINLRDASFLFSALIQTR